MSVDKGKGRASDMSMDTSNETVKEDTENSKKPTKSAPKRVIRVGQGTGGTFVVGSDVPDDVKGTRMRGVVYIGAEECLETVGIYFEIRPNRCFCCHIAVRESDLDQEQLQQLAYSVHFKMEQHSVLHGWTAHDVIQDTVIVVCKRPDHTQLWAAEGVRRFLGVPNPMFAVDDRMHGFICAPMKDPEIPIALTPHDNHFPMKLFHLDSGLGLSINAVLGVQPRCVDPPQAQKELKRGEWNYWFGIGWNPQETTPLERVMSRMTSIKPAEPKPTADTGTSAVAADSAADKKHLADFLRK